MRRILSPSVALLAGLVTLLTGCAGETPTTPTGSGSGGAGGTGGTCAVSIQLVQSSLSAQAGNAVVIRATVTKGGAAVPDGQSVFFTTDNGFFLETGLPNASKVIISGVADITLASQFAGVANVKATFDCGSATTAVNFTTVPVNGPFISSISPTTGTCAGGDTVTINGGRFGAGATTANTRVTFGGLPATITSVSDSVIIVKTPARTPQNPLVPEQVDVVVTLGAGSAGSQTVTMAKGFTYNCTAQRMLITSVVPSSGPQEGGTQVTISGQNFGTSVATTRVTFGGTAATVSSVSDTAIIATTPRHMLANANVPETVDVSVTRDLGQPSQQNAVLPNAFIYRGTVPPGQCPPSPSLYITSVQPNTGVPEGGDIVTITGNGFGTSVATTQVLLGGSQAQVTSVTNTEIKFSTPRRTLANPNVPETVNLVVTTDAGGSSCASATLTNAFTYTMVALQPNIFSVSPRTGPNDVSTRVTIFGENFSFPSQVLLTGGTCSGYIEAAVVSIKSNEIVFLTPIASNGNLCLANALASIRVLNPKTGKLADYADAFKYYACPTVSVAVPSYGAYNVTTPVTINGQNFAEPVEAEFTTSGGTTGATRLTVSSVSVSAIVVQMPPADVLQGSVGGVDCSNLVGEIKLTFPALSCPGALTVPFTYKVDAPQVTNASPTQLTQLQTPPQTVTVTGAFFSDPMTVVLTKGGSALDYTRVNNAIVSNPSTLSFPAPAIRDADMNTQACVPSGGTTNNGVMYVPTSFGIRVTNARTGCSADLPNILVYNPADPSCRLAAVITGPATLPAAVMCTAYPSTQITAVGTGVLTFSATGLPTGMTISSTGLITGTPSVSPAGPGAASGTFAVTVSVTDTSVPPTTATRSYSLAFTDPSAPFVVTGPAAATISGTTGGATGAYSYAPGASGAVTWSIVATPATTAGLIHLSATTGATTTVVVDPTTTPTGAYTVTVTATDACGHTASAPLALTVN